MDIKQDQAAKRLLKKLSALRATLKNDERKLLDQLLTGSADEVEAHVLRPQANVASAKGVDEVEAHVLRPQATISSAKSTKHSADEVEAHVLRPQSTVASAKTVKVAPDEVEAHFLHVVFDPTKEEYQAR